MARVVLHRATVAELHGLVPFADDAGADPAGTTGDVEVWWCDPTDAAVALGSRQRPEMLDPDACARAGLGVVRRRSGGGAVIVRPGEMCWIDLIVPHGVAPDDVRGSVDTLRNWCAEYGRDPADIEAGIGLQPGDGPRVLDQHAEEYLSLGFTQFTFGSNGPDHSLAGLEDWLAWRDEVNAR